MADSSKPSSRTRRLSMSMQERIRRYEVSSSSSEASEMPSRGLEAEDVDSERHQHEATGVTRVTGTSTDHQVGKNNNNQ